MLFEAVPALLPARRWIGSVAAVLLFKIVAGGAPISAQALTPAEALQPAYVAGLDSLPDAPQPQEAGQSQGGGSEKAVAIRDTPMNIIRDQGVIWTSPFRIRGGDLKWIVPIGLVTAAIMTTDRQAVTSTLSHDKTFNHDSAAASNVLTAGLIAAPVALFGRGQWRDNDQDREAGILGGEALVDGVVVEQGMKLIFWRERPSADGGRGKFFQSSAGIDSSFPSSHSVLSWASAAVLAEEYPTWWARAGVYSMAAGVTATRVLALEHFPSDVVVGSTVGWLVGHYVYRKHHKIRQILY